MFSQNNCISDPKSISKPNIGSIETKSNAIYAPKLMFNVDHRNKGFTEYFRSTKYTRSPTITESKPTTIKSTMKILRPITTTTTVQPTTTTSTTTTSTSTTTTSTTTTSTTTKRKQPTTWYGCLYYPSCPYL